MLHNVLNQMKAKNLGSGKYSDGQGLWLVKRDKDAGKWILRAVIEGKRREMGLGRWPDVSIAEARERATAARLGNSPAFSNRAMCCGEYRTSSLS